MVLAVCLAGCKSDREAGSELPANVAEAVTELRKLEKPIIEALRSGNPGEADQQLHSAMFVAEHLPDIARKDDVAGANLDEITDTSKELFDLLTDLHDGSHGSGSDVAKADELVSEIEQALGAFKAAIP